MKRAEIIVSGLVQGVGFRYYTVRQATRIGVKGYVMNLPDDRVLAVAEGEIHQIEELYHCMKTGPSRSSVKSCKIIWKEALNEFNVFDIRN